MSSIDKIIKETINDVLDIEHGAFAKKLGLINEPPQELNYNVLVNAIASIDELSRREDEYSKRVGVLLLALTWQHADPDYKESLRQLFTKFLSRMGISPSIALIDTQIKETKKISSLSSYIDEICITADQLKYEIQIGESRFLLTEFQRNVWKSVSEHKIVGISAPTSAGKSFIIYLKIIDSILNGERSFLYIVPTISLVNQVTRDICNFLRTFSINDIQVYTHFNPDIKSNVIYVLTQERVINAFSEGNEINSLSLLVIDEVQNLERASEEDDQRAKILYDVIKEIRHNSAPKSIILSGPRLQNLGNLGFELFDEVSHEEESKVQPVANITYSIYEEKKSYYLNQYVDILNFPRRVLIKNSDNISGLGKARYDDSFHNYLWSLLSATQKNESNLIFSPNPGQARNTARFIYSSLQDKNIDDAGLSSYIKESVHPDYDLCLYVKSGTAYHAGPIPQHIRAAIEDAFSKGVIRNIVCTTTLIQGVNFPASNVYIRNPNLFINKPTNREPPKLSNYEFSNLRGRAGRLLKEFVGRTIVLDESKFEKENPTESLFHNAEKQISTGYGASFSMYADEIRDALSQNISPTDGSPRFLVTHIRQTLLRHGERGIKRLAETGISISKEEALEIIQLLDGLHVPKELCTNNRYWDPIDLKRMLDLIKSGAIRALPADIWEGGLEAKLEAATLSMQRYFPTYFDRYLGTPSTWGMREDIFIPIACKYAVSWGREVLLRDILSTPYFNTDASEKIDTAVKTITNKSSYGLPMLLRPLAQISHNENPMLSFIESGAYHPATKFLIGRGVPRDTAVMLRQNHLSHITDIDLENVDPLVRRLQKIKSELNIWEQYQIEAITG